MAPVDAAAGAGSGGFLPTFDRWLAGWAKAEQFFDFPLDKRGQLS
jgi:hypothetical protein